MPSNHQDEEALTLHTECNKAASVMILVKFTIYILIDRYIFQSYERTRIYDLLELQRMIGNVKDDRVGSDSTHDGRTFLVANVDAQRWLQEARKVNVRLADQRFQTSSNLLEAYSLSVSAALPPLRPVKSIPLKRTPEYCARP